MAPFNPSWIAIPLPIPLDAPYQIKIIKLIIIIKIIIIILITKIIIIIPVTKAILLASFDAIELNNF